MIDKEIDRQGIDDDACCMGHDIFSIVGFVFDLRRTDIVVLREISSKETLSAEEVGRLVGRDRSTAHRSLERLVRCGLCIKGRKGVSPRGFFNTYRRISDRELGTKAREGLNRLSKKITAFKNGNDPS